MHLALRFLGPFEAQLDNETKIESRAKKIEALLAFLSTEADRAHRRDRLVGLLFPEMPDEQARTNLRQTLTRLRRAIGDQQAEPRFLLVSRESTQFNLDSDHSLDIALFKSSLEGCKMHQPKRDPNCEDCIQKLTEAANLYRGSFLEGFALDDSAAYEEWLLVKREQYKEEVLSALQQLGDFFERRGAYDVATDYVRHQLRIEPWKEDAHQQLIRLFAYQGERAAALQHYNSLETMLWDELGVKPLATTRALHDQIRAAETNRPRQLPHRNPDFIGRNNELALLQDHLADPERRLITLTGPGGSGKTAIAIETGWRAADLFIGPFFHGVFFVPLVGIDISAKAHAADASNFDPLITAIAEAVDFSFSGSRHPRQQLLRYLHDKSILLIVDNVEHVISEARSLFRDLLHTTLGITILNTSRERLGLGDEWVLEIEGLPYPGDDQPDDAGGQEWPDPASLSAQFQAIALFESMGKKLVSDFELSSNGIELDRGSCPVTAVQRIAQMVQGLPLGIQLAASWIRTLSCVEIAQEIEKNFDFLSSTMHDIPSRHQSLRAVFDSSWQLLDKKERQILRRLAVFAGPFDRSAATAVSGASIVTINSLVDHSLLHYQGAHAPDQTTGSYELLDVLRQFAVERLDQDHEEAERFREQHAAYYLQFLVQQQNILLGSEQRTAVADIAHNIKEIRSAWRWAVQHHDFPHLSQALDALGLYYYMRSWFTEGVELFALATRELEAARGSAQTEILWARLRARQGWFTFLVGRQQEGRDQLLESIQILREEGEPADLAFSLSFAAAALSILGKYEEATQLADESLAINELCQDEYGCAISNNILGQIAFQQGDYAAAKQYSETSLAIERAFGNQWSIGFSLSNLGQVAFALGNYQEADDYFHESLAIRKALQDKRGQALCLRYSGNIALARNDEQRAQQDFTTSLALFRSIGSQDETSATLYSLGQLALHRQDRRAARRNFVESLQVARQAASAPRILEAISGIARLLAESEPLTSAQLAVTVQNHPAVNRTGREQAGLLLKELQSSKALDDAAVDLEVKTHADLDTLGDELLAMLGDREDITRQSIAGF